MWYNTTHNGILLNTSKRQGNHVLWDKNGSEDDEVK